MRFFANYIAELGKALCFLGEITRHIFRGHVRTKEVLKQMYEQETHKQRKRESDPH